MATSSGPNGGGVMRFELPNASPVGAVAAQKWGIWRDILGGRSPAERSMLLRHATQAFNHPSEFEASRLGGRAGAGQQKRSVEQGLAPLLSGAAPGRSARRKLGLAGR